MKKIYMFSALMCASVFSFTGCIEETFENPVPANDGDEIVFGARAGFENRGTDTKTIYAGGGGFVAENDFEYTACFLGGNLPNTEWLAEHGMDGTFENGGMDGWKAEDRNNGDSSAWAKFERSTDIAYNGDYSLRFYARYRTSFFTFNNLKKSTNYLLTFYVNDRAVFDPREDESDLEYNEEARINWFSITSGATTLYEDFGTSDAPSMKGGSGWYKVSIPFNTGDFTNVDWNLYYTNKDKQPDNYI